MKIRLKALIDIINFSQMDTYLTTNEAVLDRHLNFLKMLVNQDFYNLKLEKLTWDSNFLTQPLDLIKLKNKLIPFLEKAKANIDQEKKLLIKNLKHCLDLKVNNKNYLFSFKVFKTDWKNNFQYAIFEIDQTKTNQYQINDFNYQINKNLLRVIFKR